MVPVDMMYVPAMVPCFEGEGNGTCADYTRRHRLLTAPRRGQCRTVCCCGTFSTLWLEGHLFCLRVGESLEVHKASAQLWGKRMAVQCISGDVWRLDVTVHIYGENACLGRQDRHG